MKYKIALILLIILNVSLWSNLFQTASEDKGILVNKGITGKWCPKCGMDLIKFFKTNTYIISKDNTKTQYCSFHCLISAENHGDFYRDKLNGIFAVDVESEKFYPADKLLYVVGSKIPGTMTKISKYPFISRNKAVQFVKKFGGNIRSFEETIKETKGHLASDKKMITLKRERMIMPMGEKIYHKICDKDALQKIKYKNLSELKSQIIKKNICGKLNGKQIQALTLYIALKQNSGNQKFILNVPEGSKCPVCGMFVAKYPRWASMIELESGKKLYFDGAKDLFKFYFRAKYYLKTSTEPIIKKILLKDYYSGEILDGKKSLYVIGSDVYGPMGKELIPHRSKDSALIFFKDHKGKRIILFSEIDNSLIESLDK